MKQCPSVLPYVGHVPDAVWPERNNDLHYSFGPDSIRYMVYTYGGGTVSLARMLYLSLSVGARLGKINDQYFNILFGRARRNGAPHNTGPDIGLEWRKCFLFLKGKTAQEKMNWKKKGYKGGLKWDSHDRWSQ